MFITFEDFLNVEMYLLLPFFRKAISHAYLAGVVWAVGLKRGDWAPSPRYHVLWQCDITQGQPRPPSPAALPTFSSLSLCYRLFLPGARARAGRPLAVFLY